MVSRCFHALPSVHAWQYQGMAMSTRVVASRVALCVAYNASALSQLAVLSPVRRVLCCSIHR